MITGTKLGPDRRAITKSNERPLDIPRDRPAGEHAAELARELRDRRVKPAPHHRTDVNVHH